jgi:hypothetical protein
MCRRSRLFREQDVVKPRYLIDDLQACLVSGQTAQSEYIALSYQWGQTRNLRNTRKLCERLFPHGSLALPEFASDIPRTIKDAFAVVKLLGYRYLWVDALCIVSPNC